MAPSDAQIDELCHQCMDFAGMSRAEALVLLKGESYDVQRAVAQFFDYDRKVDAYKQSKYSTWDESAFAGDRDGGQLNERAVVPYDESVMGPHAAPSRPPSRAQNSVQHIGTSTGWDSSSTRWPGSGFEGEDEAIALSLRDQGQETGITSSSWGQATSSCEIVPDVDAVQRRRGSGQPAFLKPLPNRDFFPAIMSIVFQIPQCRAALMFNDACFENYGFNESWWRGEKVVSPSIRYNDGDESPGSDSHEQAMSIAKECQRVMAFLAATKRTYGSSWQLAEQLDVQPDYPPTWHDSAPFERALQKLDELLSLIEKPVSLFTSEVCDLDGTATEQKFFIDAQVDRDGMTLYDALDKRLWGTAEKAGHDGWTSRRFISSLASIVLIRLRTADATGPMRKVSVPAVFFADRYMISNASILEETRRRIELIEQARGERQARLNDLTKHFLNPPMKEVDSKQMMATVLKYAKQQESEGTDDRMIIDGDDSDTKVEASLVAQLEALAERVERRVQELTNEQQELARQLSEQASVLTSSDAKDGPSPRMAYHLQGVASADHRRPFVVYVATQPEDNAYDAVSGRLWWRMSYDVAGARPEVKVEPAEQDHVLEFAAECNPEILLVYATEEALSTKDPVTLPEALEAFVREDNAIFDEELQDIASQPAPRSQMQAMPPEDLHAGYGQPQVRRRLSNDSTTVQGGDSGRHSFDNDDEGMMSAEAETQAFSSHRPMAGATGLEWEGREMQQIQGSESISMKAREARKGASSGDESVGAQGRGWTKNEQV